MLAFSTAVNRFKRLLDQLSFMCRHRTKNAYFTRGTANLPAACLSPACRLPVGRQGRQGRQDRGFFATKWLAELQEHGVNFLFRVSRQVLKEINAADLPDQIITLDRPDKGAAPFKVRVINVPLPSGESERLVTNVFEPKLTVSDFSELYRQRWGVEVGYLILKERLANDVLASDFGFVFFGKRIAGGKFIILVANAPTNPPTVGGKAQTRYGK